MASGTRPRPAISVLGPALGMMLGLLLASGCGSEPEDAASSGPGIAREVPGVEFPEIDDAIAVGVLLDQSGMFTSLDGPLLLAVEAEVARVNQAGGIGGVPIALAVTDSRSDVDGALDAFRRMRNIGTEVFLVGCDAPIANALAARTNDGTFVLIDLCASAPGRAGDSTAVALGLGADALGAGLSQSAVAAGWNSVVVVADADDVSQFETCDAFAAAFVADGRRVDARYDFAPNEQSSGLSRGALLDDLTDGTRPDGVIICVRADRAAGLLEAIRLAAPTPVIASPASAAAAAGANYAAIVVISSQASDSPLVAPGAAAAQLLVDAYAGDAEAAPATLFAMLGGPRATAIGPIVLAADGSRSDGRLTAYLSDGVEPGLVQVGSWGPEDAAPDGFTPVASPGRGSGEES